MKAMLLLLFFSICLMAQDSSDTLIYKAEKDCFLLNEPRPQNGGIRVYEGDSLYYFGFAEDDYYCKVKYKTSNGYLASGYVPSFVFDDQLQSILREKKIKQQKADSLKAKMDKAYQELLDAVSKEIRHVELIKRFGKKNAKKILDGKIWLGMTDKMARESWGEPNDINRSVGSWGVHEQWVYGDTYLYFENGKLKSWQD